VVVAHIARLALDANNEPLPPSADPDQPFSEMAMYVLVRREGKWGSPQGRTPRCDLAVPSRHHMKPSFASRSPQAMPEVTSDSSGCGVGN
jgi:hypothetical protein